MANKLCNDITLYQLNSLVKFDYCRNGDLLAHTLSLVDIDLRLTNHGRL